jgi:DNA repair photolyase
MQDDSETFARKSVRGRGTGDMAKGRFESVEVRYEEGEEIQVPTQIFPDKSRSIISTHQSPDIGVEATLNPYRGCEHGCIYCYARPTHEYLGMSAGLDFETKIFVKYDAPELLRAEFMKKSWEPKTITLSGITDCYQPLERELKLTRGCLEVCEAFGNPAVIITKNALVTRDLDILSNMARRNLIHVCVSITSLDAELIRKLEPRTSTPSRRLWAVRQLHEAGVPVSVNVAPVIPGLTDHEILPIVSAAAEAGARNVHYTIVRLPYGVKDLFQAWVAEHYPHRAGRILNRIRSVRGGALNSAQFGSRMKGEGIFADQIRQMVHQARQKNGLPRSSPPLTVVYFCRPTDQFVLF